MMPACVAFSTARTSGSVAAGSKIGWPSDRLMMSMPKVWRFAIANSIARITSLVLPAPFAVQHLQADEPHTRRNALVLQFG